MKKSLALLLSLILLLAPLTARGEGTPSPTPAPTPAPEQVSAILTQAPDPLCLSAALVEGETGELLYGFAEHEVRYPASITKVMTALLVLEAVDRGELDLEEEIVASESYGLDLETAGSTQGILPGEVLTLHELLYCLLVASANEAANILAEAVDGSVPAFVDRMNRRAAELGMADTHFVNAHGLHHANHYTTAWDIARMVREALQNDTFAAIVSTKSHVVPATNLSPERKFTTTNALLTPNRYPGYTYAKAIGVKTGTTGDAGQCLASAAVSKGRTLICVVLGAENVKQEDGSLRRDVFLESRRLLEWGFQNFSAQTLVDPKSPVTELPVTLSADTSAVALKPQQGLEAVLPNDLKARDFQRDITTYYTSVAAPVEAGQILGEMTVRNGSTVYGTVKLVAAASAERSELLWRLEQVKTFFGQTWVRIALAALGVLVAVLILRAAFHKPKTGYTGRRRR